MNWYYISVNHQHKAIYFQTFPENYVYASLHVGDARDMGLRLAMKYDYVLEI